MDLSHLSQAKPNHLAQTLWLKILQLISNHNSKLFQLCGKWLTYANQQCCVWKSYYHKNNYVHQTFSPNDWSIMTRHGKQWIHVHNYTAFPELELILCLLENKPFPVKTTKVKTNTNGMSYDQLIQQLYSTKALLSQQNIYKILFAVAKHFDNKQPISLISDKSSVSNRMMLRWVIICKQTTFLAESARPMYGDSKFSRPKPMEYMKASQLQP